MVPGKNSKIEDKTVYSPVSNTAKLILSPRHSAIALYKFPQINCLIGCNLSLILFQEI